MCCPREIFQTLNDDNLHCIVKALGLFLTVWQLLLEWEVAYEAEDGSCHVDAPVTVYGCVGWANGFFFLQSDHSKTCCNCFHPTGNRFSLLVLVETGGARNAEIVSLTCDLTSLVFAML